MVRNKSQFRLRLRYFECKAGCCNPFSQFFPCKIFPSSQLDISKFWSEDHLGRSYCILTILSIQIGFGNLEYRKKEIGLFSMVMDVVQLL